MFGLSAVSVSVKHRASGAHALSEVIATAGLLLVIGRISSDTFAGIAPSSAPVFIATQIAGVIIIRFLYPALAPGPGRAGRRPP